jgi:DNA end-binding protein Ku
LKEWHVRCGKGRSASARQYPVELFVGARDHTPRFRLLHRTDLSPISLERVCQTDGKAVAWDDLVKGYEVEKGRFIAPDRGRFQDRGDRAQPQHRHPGVRAAPRHRRRYWDTPYYATARQGRRARLQSVRAGARKSGRAGIAKYVMRQREHLAALLPVNGCLVVSTMRFEEDLVEVPHTARAKVSAQELKLADQLISTLAAEWSPAAYHDDYVPALMKVIKAKAAGKKMPAVSGKPTPPTKVVDLMARLKESLAAAQPGSRAARSSRASTRRASTSAASQRRTRRGRRPAA